MGLGLLVGVAALGVISARSVVERRQQIGVMRAIGFRRRMVEASFLLESSFLALTSIVVGTLLGLLLAWNIIDDTRRAAELGEPDARRSLAQPPRHLPARLRRGDDRHDRPGPPRRAGPPRRGAPLRVTAPAENPKPDGGRPHAARRAPLMAPLRPRAKLRPATTEGDGTMTMRKVLEYGGILAGVVLIAFGIGALWLSFDARSTVQDELAREQIVGGDDMSPEASSPGSTRPVWTCPLPTATSPARRSTRGRGALLLAVHAHPRPRVLGRPDLRPDGPLPGRRRSGEPRPARATRRRR